MNSFFTSLPNPIIAIALRRRRIGWQFVTALILALLAYCPAVTLFITWLSATLLVEDNVTLNNMGQMLGKSIFYPTVLLLLILVTLFAPVLSVGTIAGERQRQTLHLVIITLLSSRDLAWGKLITAMIDIFILIAAVWPVILISAVVGTISLIELVVVTLLLIITAFAFTNIGLYISSRSKTIINATMLTYGLALPGFLIGPFLVMFLITLLALFIDNSKLMGYGWGLAASLNPITAAIYSYVLHQDNGGIILTETPSLGYIIYPWVIYTLFYGLIAWLLFEATVYHLNKAGET